MQGLSPVAVSGGHSSSRCAGLSLLWPLPLRSTGSRCASSVVVAHGLSCSAACGIFPDQGSNPCPLHWQADSQPLRHQGSPIRIFLKDTSGHPWTRPPSWWSSSPISVSSPATFSQDWSFLVSVKRRTVPLRITL